jgi:hypothetical protein
VGQSRGADAVRQRERASPTIPPSAFGDPVYRLFRAVA